MLGLNAVTLLIVQGVSWKAVVGVNAGVFKKMSSFCSATDLPRAALLSVAVPSLEIAVRVALVPFSSGPLRRPPRPRPPFPAAMRNAVPSRSSDLRRSVSLTAAHFLSKPCPLITSLYLCFSLCRERIFTPFFLIIDCVNFRLVLLFRVSLLSIHCFNSQFIPLSAFGKSLYHTFQSCMCISIFSTIIISLYLCLVKERLLFVILIGQEIESLS